MSKLDKIKKYYIPKLKEGNFDYEKLGWESSQAQNMRFGVLDGYFGSCSSILDVGCGLADLYSYIKNRGINIKYTGIDIMREMVDMAVCRHLDTSIYCYDIFNDDHTFFGSFDIVFSSGIFNIDLGNNLDFLYRAIIKFNEISARYIIFNLLSDRSTTKEDGYFYYNEDQVRDLVIKSGIKYNSIKIIDDYLMNDFSIIIDRSFK